MIPNWLIFTLLGIWLAGTCIWAIRSDRNQDRRLGRRALNDLGKSWRLHEDKLSQSQAPFYHAMPSESASFMRLTPVLSREFNGSTAWLFGNPTNPNPNKPIGSCVMVAIPIQWPYQFLLRLQPYKLGDDWKRRIWDSRFDLVGKEYAHHRWWLCSTKESQLTERLARNIAKQIKTDAVLAVQIGHGYLVTSCETMCRGENYLRAWEGTEEIWDILDNLSLPMPGAL